MFLLSFRSSLRLTCLRLFVRRVPSDAELARAAVVHDAVEHPIGLCRYGVIGRHSGTKLLEFLIL